ncbi:MAG: 3D domain-containing protein [Clostridium sp.]|nr:3D domain-containing protein [Clostridium sp.]
MGGTLGRKIFPVLLSAVILYSLTSYAAQTDGVVLVDLGAAAIEQGPPGSSFRQQQETKQEQQAIPERAGKAGSVQETEVSWGVFEITGYCACEICTGVNQFTYWETVPKAGHTVAADLHIFPLGTRLKIDGIIYTVEDRGSSVNDNHIDIFYDTHQEALDSGRRYIEVFRIVEPD